MIDGDKRSSLLRPKFYSTGSLRNKAGPEYVDNRSIRAVAIKLFIACSKLERFSVGNCETNGAKFD
jgi:hypothetical protein